MRKILTVLVLVLVCGLSFAQTQEEKELAYNNALNAIQLMDNGEVDKAIGILEECCELDGDSYFYPYEIGYAYCLQKEYKKAIGMFKKVVKMEGSTDQSYQMLGNAYDFNGQRKKAIKTYQKGLEKYPESGRLYLELGVMYHGTDWNKALEYHERGIEIDPGYPSNYFWASKIFCGSTEEVWGVLYGEIFMNIERGSERTEEISKLLYDVYESEIKFTNDTSFSVSFSQNNVLVLGDDVPALPYGIGVFEPTLMIACVGEDSISIASLNNIRTKFVDFYTENGFQEKYPNALIDWHSTLIEKDFFESYNYWIFMMGSLEFERWFELNEDKFNEFVEWFSENPMPVVGEHSFHRLKY